MNIEEILTYKLFEFGDQTITLLLFLKLLGMGGIFYLVAHLCCHTLYTRLKKIPNMDPSLLYTFSRILHYSVIALGVLVVLHMAGIRFQKIALVGGALGIGIGFGLQNIVNNFVSGLILLVERSLRVGDFIEISPEMCGIVREISVRSTRIATNENVDILIPNADLVNNKVVNWTFKEGVRLFRIPFGVAYGTEKETVKTAAIEAANQVRHTYLEDAKRLPSVRLVNFGNSSLDFELVVWLKPEAVRNPDQVIADYLWAISSTLQKYNIEIPFPQRDLHLKSSNLSLTKDEFLETDFLTSGPPPRHNHQTP